MNHYPSLDCNPSSKLIKGGGGFMKLVQVLFCLSKRSKGICVSFRHEFSLKVIFKCVSLGVRNLLSFEMI